MVFDNCMRKFSLLGMSETARICWKSEKQKPPIVAVFEKSVSNISNTAL